jgi:N-acyl-D-aspartate/D-glutamate deacylase
MRADQSHDLLIRGGRVVDPESGVDAVRDVAISAGTVQAVGEDLMVDAAATIDARGLVVTAGFVDLHSHAATIPGLRLQATDGVTTALELEAGVVPVSLAYRIAETEGRPINFGFSASWAQARMSVLAGHEPDGSLDGFLRNIADPRWQRDATPNEIRRICGVLERELGDGALGFGILAGYAPHIGPEEYRSVAERAAASNVPTFTHIRDLREFSRTAIIDGAEEVVAAARETGAQMHVCHIHASCRRHIGRALDLIRQARADGARVSTEAYPYGRGMTGIGAAFLEPSELHERGLTVENLWYVPSRERVRDDDHLRELRKTDPAGLVLIENLVEQDPGDREKLIRALAFDEGIIASDAMPILWDGPQDPMRWPIPGSALTHPRTAGTFSRSIRLLHRELGAALPDVLARCSLRPAQLLESSVPSMRRKGRLSVGSDADIVAFRLDEITDRATYTDCLALSDGIEHVLVGGVPIVSDGVLVEDVLPGRAVRR